jgi:hypothetical protein
MIDSMRTRVLWLALLLCVAARSPLFAQVQLVPAVSGLNAPTFVTNARDGTRRLFILEQAGLIRVLQPGSTTPTTFLDIRSRVRSGGEQGLLGLAFHPLYPSNGRFFVYYTRSGDGAIVMAEYRVSSDRNVAATNETVLLTIPHPVNTNHNGGMLAFGPDGYLYAGVGDGGAANDPPGNAQNLDALLGKILRIDVNVPAGSTPPYASPISNPFFGSIAGRDEIYAYGLRNPWRFSFDRVTGQVWIGDVGQNAREEVDTPLVNGGNYGWRIFEGTACTNITPSQCVAANFLFPRFDYTHAGGRCSITGGYVYRGTEGTLPPGTYVYADYCTGEIFTWNGTAQTVLFDTSMSISSFGEDESGEIYVVNLDGAISRLASTATSACTYTVSPERETFKRPGGRATFTVTTDPACSWTAITSGSWISIDGNPSGTGSGAFTAVVSPAPIRPFTRDGSISVGGKTVTIRQTR